MGRINSNNDNNNRKKAAQTCPIFTTYHARRSGRQLTLTLNPQGSHLLIYHPFRPLSHSLPVLGMYALCITYLCSGQSDAPLQRRCLEPIKVLKVTHASAVANRFNALRMAAATQQAKPRRCIQIAWR